ncbi:hypothetical protein WJX73_009996 [Symbiochloris irregularis]|uniref:PNPLA domain-containing protein n=1 Tax=Symbiochloris irregularis TaxID=706552 RepID=A0AAW1NTQ3_9CHLO
MKGPATSFTGPAGRLPCRSLSPGDKFSSILLDVAIWRGLLALGEPVRRLLAALLFLARSGLTLAGDLKRGLWQALGWLSAPPRTPAIRQLGLNLAGARRWHYALASLVIWAAVREVTRRLLRADLLRNLGNMTNSELHENFPMVPEPIREYIDEVKEHLQFLTEYEGPALTIQDKLAFLRETRHAFGRTALVLSGGGALGAFHVGVVKSLFEQKLLPRVLAGSSVGSIVAAIVATRNDAELHELFDGSATMDLSFFSNSTASQFLRHFLLKGVLQDAEVLQKRLRRLLGDATFLQAFAHSGRILNVAVSPADTNEPARILNYLTAPHVVIWSAVSCSSAFPFLFLPQDLLARDANGELVRATGHPSMHEGERRWRDGSLEEDLPMRSLGEMFNVNYFLVSQTNPHIVPALNLKKRFNRKLGNLAEAEWKHRCRQLMEVWPSARWLKVFSQPWEGDVTMVLPSTYMQIKKSITNPSLEDLKLASLEGERVTWEKLSAIQANCGIEMKLDQCMVRIGEKIMERSATERGGNGSNGQRRHSLRARSMQKMSRIPSWLNMSALGMPNVGSDDAMDGKFLRTTSVEETHLPTQPSLHRLSGSSWAAPASESRGQLHEQLQRHSPHPHLEHLRRSSGSGAAHIPPLEAVDEGKAEAFSPRPFQPSPVPNELAAMDTVLSSLPDSFPLPKNGHSAAASSLDCTDRSVNLWDTLLPLHSAAGGGHALDVIAP